MADVHELSMNMQMARNEHELQPENTILTVLCGVFGFVWRDWVELLLLMWCRTFC